MTQLIQSLNRPLANKLKEVVTPDEKIYFCIEGAKRNAIVGTDKKLVAISAGSFRGSISYSYSYDNIMDIKINPPLHGKYITMDIIAVNEDKELKPKLYFDPEQKKIIRQVLAKISSLSNTYTYKEEIKEIRAYKSKGKLVVPMKNILGKIFKETISHEEKVILSVSLGDTQGVVITDIRILLFKINEVDDTYKVGDFLLEDITDILYSVGIVTGQLQIITSDTTVLKKKLREQELLEVDNVISFSKKNYEGVMELVYKNLDTLVNGEEADRNDILNEAVSLEDLNIKKNGTDRSNKIKEKKIEKRRKKDKKIRKSEAPPSRGKKTNIFIDPKLEEVAVKLSKEILEEIYTDSQPFIYNYDIVKQIADEVVRHSFPELVSPELVDLVAAKIIGSIPKKNSADSFEKEETFIDEMDGFQENFDFVPGEEVNIDIDDFMVGEEDTGDTNKASSNNILKEKLDKFTSLKNISAALLLERKTGNLISQSFIEPGSYYKTCKIANKFLRANKKLSIFVKSPSQWLVEYQDGLIYLDKITVKYLLMIVGTKNSNFGTLKLFIEKIKKELKSKL